MFQSSQGLQKESGCEHGSETRNNVNGTPTFSDESQSSSSEDLSKSFESDGDWRDSLETLTAIFTDTDDSEKEFEGYPNDNFCETDFTQKTIQSSNGLQKESGCEHGSETRNNVNGAPTFSDESLSNSSENLSKSFESDGDWRDSLEILTTIFTDTDDSEKEFEGFPNDNFCETDFSQKTIQSSNDIQYKNAITCCTDRDTKENMNSKGWYTDEWKLCSSEEDSDVPSVMSDGTLSGLSEIVSNIFADTDDNEEDFEGFADSDTEEMQFARKKSETAVKVSAEENILMSPSVANGVSNELFSDYSSDEEIKKIKDTIVQHIIKECLGSSDEETEELKEKKQKCHIYLKDNH